MALGIASCVLHHSRCNSQYSSHRRRQETNQEVTAKVWKTLRVLGMWVSVKWKCSGLQGVILTLPACMLAVRLLYQLA